MDTAAAHAAIRLHLLGDPRIEIGGAPFPLERKDAGLLAMLAVDGPTPRAKAAALLWPDVDDEAARNNLRQRLHRLRRRAGRDIAETTSDVLRLADGVSHDIDGMAELLTRSAAAAPGELLGTLDYGDCEQFDGWVRGAREQWRGARRDALADIASRLERDGRIAQALPYAERLIADEPLLEHAHRRVMRLHYLRGDRAAALAAYERCRELLERELGAAPGRETVDLAALVESSGTLAAPVTAPRPVAMLRPPRLVGREEEWRRLDTAWEQCRPVLVCGEPGIGKTRLMSDFAARHDGALVVGARPGDARVPYALLARLLRAVGVPRATDLEEWVRSELTRLLPELGPVPATRLQPVRLQRAAEHVLAAARGGGLSACFVDDLHFADDASIEALLAIAGSESGRALRWCAGVRPAEMPSVLAEWLAGSQAGGEADAVARIDLAPLDARAIEALLASLALPGFDAAAWAEPLARHTGGNPLFILETLAALLAQGAAAATPAGPRLPAPGSVGQLIERRLGQLSAAALRLARIAALAGQDFSVDLAARVLQVHPLDLAQPWQELEAAQVIRDDAFAHDLIFEATLRSVPQAIAQVMHRDIAAQLQAQRVPPARVAQHWQQAREWSRAGAAFSAAAKEARAASQRAAEAEHWERAAECFDAAGADADAFGARFESVEATLLIHGVERAHAVIDRMAAAAEAPLRRVDVLAARAMACLMGADHARGIAAAREALDLAQQLDSPWQRFEAARLLAVGLAQSDHAVDALPVIEPFRELVEREGSIEQRGRFWADYAYVLNSARRLRRTADALLRSIEIAREAGDYGEMATVTSNYALTLGNLGRTEEALEQSLRARALRMQLGDPGGPASGAIDMYVGMLAGGVGRYREALASLDAALDCFERGGQPLWIAVARNHRTTYLIDLGQIGRAQKGLDYAAPSMETLRARREVLLARIERLQGRDGSAAVGRALALLGERGDPHMRMLTQLEEAETLPPPAAVARCRAVQEMAEQLEYLGIAAKARLMRARHLLRAGDADAAANTLLEPAPHLDGVQAADAYRAERWCIEFEVFGAVGEVAAATASLAEAIDWINAVALPEVPDEFKDSFLNRNPVNRALLTAATRRARR